MHFMKLYHLTLGIGADSYDRMSGALMLDGAKVAEIRSLTFNPVYDEYHQSTVTVVVECPTGGEVWVQCQEDGGQIYGFDDEPRTVFTGYAITYYIHP